MKNQRRNVAGCKARRSVCPTHMPAQAIANATSAGAATLTLSAPANARLTASAMVETREGQAEGLNQFLLLEADGLQIRHGRDHEYAGSGCDQASVIAPTAGPIHGSWRWSI